MKFTYIASLVLQIFLTIKGKSYNQDDYPELDSPYMGEDAPDMAAEKFVPGIISTEFWKLQGVFEPNMNEFYITLDNARGKLIDFEWRALWRLFIANNQNSINMCMIKLNIIYV